MRSIQNKKDWQRELSNCEIKEKKEKDVPQIGCNGAELVQLGLTSQRRKRKNEKRRNGVIKKKIFLRAKRNVKSRSKV